MRSGGVGDWLVAVAGGLIFLSAFAHAGLGWPALKRELPPTTDPDVLGAIGVGWHFGSVAMATFGLLAVVSAVQLRRGRASARFVPLLIGVAYVTFGAGAMAARGVGPHFMVFILLGALLVLGALLRPPSS